MPHYKTRIHVLVPNSGHKIVLQIYVFLFRPGTSVRVLARLLMQMILLLYFVCLEELLHQNKQLLSNREPK